MGYSHLASTLCVGVIDASHFRVALRWTIYHNVLYAYFFSFFFPACHVICVDNELNINLNMTIV